MKHWYAYFLIAYSVFTVCVFIALFFYTAPYGRYNDGKYNAKNTTSKNKPSKHIISSRFGWIIMEFPAMLTILIVYIYNRNTINALGSMKWLALFFLFIWEIHYVYRALIYPFLISKKSKNMSLTVIISGGVFNVFNGVLNAWWLIKIKIYAIEEVYSIHFLLGLSLFFLGFFIHIYSDYIMRKIKKSNEDYVIAHKFPHTIISNPNYFGEIIQWLGWAMCTWSLGALAFSIFTIANLVPRALTHKKWYIKNFAEYPKNKKAIFPYIL